MSYITYEVRVYDYGVQYWFKDGKIHREDGPAIVSANVQHWCKDGKMHREDGPASVFSNGRHFFYINGEEMTEQEFLERTQPAKELTVAEIEKLLGHRVKVVKG